MTLKSKTANEIDLLFQMHNLVNGFEDVGNVTIETWWIEKFQREETFWQEMNYIFVLKQ